MLEVDDIRLVDGYTVHGDDTSDSTFYIFPNGPAFARTPDGGLQLRFIEYEQLRLEGEDTFGGFVVFSADLAIPAETEAAIKAKLQEEVTRKYAGREAPQVTLAPINWAKGSVTLLLEDGGALVEKKHGAAIPSLYNTNVACFALELTDIGTAVFKNTLSTGANSAITVIYNLEYFGRLPKMHAWGEWHAEKFYSFFQSVDYEENTWSEDSYTEVVESSRYNSEVQTIGGDFVDNPNLTAEENAKIQSEIRTAIQSMLAEQVERNLLTAAAEVDPNVKSLYDEQDFENIQRTISSTQIANVRVDLTESKATLISKHPQGQLPSITTLKDAEGNALKWEDYYTKISADEFFKDKRVNVRVNAPFENLPIHTVAVSMTYPFGPQPKTDSETFTSADDVWEFESLVHDGKRDVTYTYTVNYENSAFSFTSEEFTESGDEVVINVDDLGVLSVDIAADGIDFARVPRTSVELRYDGATPVVKTLNLTAEAPNAQVREVIKEARTTPVTYKVTYSLDDGRDVTGTPGTIDVGQTTLSVRDPFGAPRTITFRALGDLANEIASVTIDATYTDPGNDYTQKKTAVLSADMPFLEWAFPVFDDTAGSVTYSGFISRKDGTTEPFGPTTTTDSIIAVGEIVADKLDVTIMTNLVDWTKVKVVLVALAYLDETNAVRERKDFTFDAPAATPPVWTIPLKDPAKTDFTSTITFFLMDGTRKVVGPTTETGTTIFPELPA
ncbi:hypothetical protein Bcav_0352 [Beutenbergia cavernae DSM 12333]|uniref:Uncharacterized protein n=1 Tax=Beutenbergia cavernae (strain ATCC BAA-8 / DSM 12333 / CCUG 43141 / JCM 11478 / NBRC 16432 / NCIMB 13614 / HKI 0122) TaxID=471853 RepID=C5BWF8_BEUC1|nr:hypothetical protein [Beutenbergia cavernae]ACQ78616.1 hypothetical protein Bcav_0352 [Beutenbergia cavernae DSM 12333]